MPDGVPPTSDANRADATAASSAGPSGSRQAVRELAEALDRARPTIVAADPALDRQIHSLRERAERPGQLDDPSFRTRLAYVLSDFEKLAGPVPSVPAALRDELTERAGTVQGLRNERLQELMRATPGLQDTNLVRDIRIVAADVAKRGQAQDSIDVRSSIEALENKVRLSAGTTLAPERTPQTPGEEGPRVRVAAVAAGQSSSVAPNSQTSSSSPGFNGPSEAQHQAAPPPQQQQRQPQNAPPQEAQYVRGPGALANIMAAMTRPPPSTTPPWEGPPTPMAERLARFQGRMQESRDEHRLEAAEHAGQAAAEALQGFSQGPAAGILAKIRDAAKADPNGMQGVMAEMRDGGRYADLRAQFNGALIAEQGFAAAYDKAAGTLSAYGKERVFANQVASARPDAASITARFAKIDAEIGEVAGAVPHKQDGKSLTAELADKAAELVQRAVEALRAALGRKDGPRPPSSGPSP